MGQKIGLFISLICAMLLTSCGNFNFGIEYDKVHIFGLIDICVEITSWHSTKIGVEVRTENGGLYLSEGTYMLIEDKCPFCDF